MLGFKKLDGFDELTLLNADDIETQYYIRMSVIDEVGVLSKISSLFAKFYFQLINVRKKGLKKL